MNLVLAHWQAGWLVWACYLALAVMHLTGLRRVLTGRAVTGSPGRASPAGGSPAGLSAGGPAATRGQLLREAATFHLGLLVALAALASPLAYWSETYIWVRAIQDLALAFFAPPLIVLGAPWLALRAGLPWPRRAAAGSPARGSIAAGSPVGRTTAAGSPVGRTTAAGSRTTGNNAANGRPVARSWRLAWPAGVTIAFSVTWLCWHLPALFDLALRSAAVRWAEYACYLGAGVAFWLQLIGSRPFSPLSGPLRRMAFLIAVVAAGTVLGMILVFGSGVLYPAYGGTAHQVMTVLDDQQLAGAIVWMGMLPPVIIAAVVLLTRWLEAEESEALTAGLDRLLIQRQSAWPSRPGSR
jgi:putative membrane protein